MGIIRTVTPVKYFVGMIAREESDFPEAIELLTEQFGEFDLVSETIEFTFTNYYEQEMGKNLLRKFAARRELDSPEKLPQYKLITNQLEEKMGEIHDGTFRRRLNMDPGYLTQGKLLLATTKNQQHRIYLGKGIFAEITLIWKDKKFMPNPWTYPDYQSEPYLDYFTNLRNLYRQQLREIDFTGHSPESM